MLWLLMAVPEGMLIVKPLAVPVPLVVTVDGLVVRVVPPEESRRKVTFSVLPKCANVPPVIEPPLTLDTLCPLVMEKLGAVTVTARRPLSVPVQLSYSG